MADITILGAGLAGCEAALWLADRGWQVELWEQKPTAYSPAHKSAGFAELVCSNSLKSDRIESAGGLLKAEMRRLGSHLGPGHPGGGKPPQHHGAAPPGRRHQPR